MPDERGYVVVRPDGTVMWETAVDSQSVSAAIAMKIHTAVNRRRFLRWLDMEREGYRLKRLRVEE